MPILHAVINVALVALVLALGMYMSPRRKTAIAAIAIAFGLGVIGFTFMMRPDLFTMVFPFSFAIFYSNFYPFAVALFVPGVLHFARKRGQKIRMAILCSALFVISLHDYREFYRPPAVTRSDYVDENGVCRQTSISTCSAAAIATLLRQYEIAATEEEVARLALTRDEIGTRHLGLYRAAKILTRGRPDLHVRLKHLSADELRRINKPAVITVGLPPKITTGPQLEMQMKWEWTPGVMHDVVFLGPWEKDATKVKIGEPDFGLEYWPIEHLETLYQGFALFVE